MTARAGAPADDHPLWFGMPRFAIWDLLFAIGRASSESVDWERFLAQRATVDAKEFDLAGVRRGDLLRVVTVHTDYAFRIVRSPEAFLQSSRSDRPRGPVRIAGCGFTYSTAFMPRRLFCGGHLEFTFVRGTDTVRFRTSPIRMIEHRRGELCLPEG